MIEGYYIIIYGKGKAEKAVCLWMELSKKALYQPYFYIVKSMLSISINVPLFVYSSFF